ncbi:MAG: hypothetical protein RIS64_4517 [Bacteroidota bacterium]|jgi:hypothetical protein
MKIKRDKFEWWLTVNPDRLLDLFKILPEELNLDYSIDSLNRLEIFLINHYTAETIVLKENHTLLDNLSRYVGEVARRHLKKAKWDVILKDKKNIYYNIPIINAPYIFGEQFCPLYTITTAISRKYGNYLHSNVQDCIDKQNIAEMSE